MAEWLKALALKPSVPQGTVRSNRTAPVMLIIEGGPFGGTPIPMDDVMLFLRSENGLGYVVTREPDGRIISIEWNEDTYRLQIGD